MRGEYKLLKENKEYDKGSPPLARGILMHSQSGNRYPGITPACAGNTIINRCSCDIDRDHPRLRGEYIREKRCVKCQLGSPPLARGIHTSTLYVIVGLRITPACAGNTLFYYNQPHITEDHPRLRGEYEPDWKRSMPIWGSPPLARGIHKSSAFRPTLNGITPACAGNTI